MAAMAFPRQRRPFVGPGPGVEPVGRQRRSDGPGRGATDLGALEVWKWRGDKQSWLYIYTIYKYLIICIYIYDYIYIIIYIYMIIYIYIYL